jgi:Septin
MRRTHISRKASGSSQLLLVRSQLVFTGQMTCPDHILIELELDEEGTRISLTIVDTPGFGDQIDNEAR